MVAEPRLTLANASCCRRRCSSRGSASARRRPTFCSQSTSMRTTSHPEGSTTTSTSTTLRLLLARGRTRSSASTGSALRHQHHGRDAITASGHGSTSPQKLAALNMRLRVDDVWKAIQAQNIEVAPGQVGQPPALKNQSACSIRSLRPHPADSHGFARGFRQHHHQGRRPTRWRRPKKGDSRPETNGSAPGGLPTSGINDPLMA